MNKYDKIVELEKFNPYHDARGRFASANSYASFTTQTRDPSKQHMADMAVAREKQKAPPVRTGAMIDEPAVHVTATYRAGKNVMWGWGNSYYTKTTLEAKETADGEITLGYATPSKTYNRNNGNVDYEYDIKHGLYQTSNRSGIDRSVGVDWDKVQTVRGQTYDAKSFLSEKGFYWDSQNKVYTKTRPTAQSSNGVLNIPRGGSLPSDLSGINSISGDTYANRAQIKAAGFKWNPESKMWVRPSVTKSNTILLDDEPRYDFVTEI